MEARIYIDIRSILDLNQATLIEIMGSEKALEYVTSDAYSFRELDIFPVDMAKLRARLKEDDVNLFKHATVTYMATVVENKLDILEKRNAFNQSTDVPEVLINMYPYSLTEEQGERLINALFLKFGSKCKVTLIGDPIDIWTPSYIKNAGVYAFYGYSFTEWVDAHGTKLETKDIRDTHLYFAAVGNQPLTDTDRKKFSKLGFKDIFTYTEYLFSPVTKLTFLPPIFYSNIITASAYMVKNQSHLTDYKPVDEQGE